MCFLSLSLSLSSTLDTPLNENSGKVRQKKEKRGKNRGELARRKGEKERRKKRDCRLFSILLLVIMGAYCEGDKKEGRSFGPGGASGGSSFVAPILAYIIMNIRICMDRRKKRFFLDL